ncbi:alkaline shock response membrane anchor protein AmaP [Olsenella massiliensis]|uniref:alkaline shock response membrane anchor protein AmaP n=1 Tax=Olsenella massiliensis TaxID=1622075 RepID=UPI00071C6709|nr:alkaline shock response membrane anchor protein AmaP [Olsenella massiliensis]
MGAFKRVCLLLFGLSGLLSLAALALPWWGSWTRAATDLLGNVWYCLALEVLMGITALGLLVCLARALLTRNRKVVIVSKVGDDAITITRDAIASQAVNVIEAGGGFRAHRVRVRARKHGHVRVSCRVQPYRAVDVVSEGEALHDRIVSGLRSVCGDNVDKVTVEFIDAGEFDPVAAARSDGRPLDAATDATPGEAPSRSADARKVVMVGAADAAGPDATEAAPQLPEEPVEITVPMSRSARADLPYAGEE